MTVEGIEAKIDRKRAKDKQKAEERNKLLMRDFAICSNTPEGLNILKFIFNMSGYSQDLLAGSKTTGEILDKMTFYRNVRRTIWLELRKMIPVNMLKKIEFEKINLDTEEL